MKLVNKLIVGILFLGMTFVFAQGNTDSHGISIVIPNVALLDIESAGSNDISLEFDAPTEAGNTLADQTDNSLWLNVTSIVASGNTRDISVKVDAPVDGLDLKVEASSVSSGFGAFGSPIGEVTLDGSDQTLVSGIRSGYTFNGADNGYQLNYTVSPIAANSFGDLESGSQSVTVTYTLTL